MRIVADLHSHSNASDGSDTPTAVVERAAKAGLVALCLSDHDTVAGVEEARAAGQRLGVEIVAGTELTCYVDGREVHILGYGIDPNDEALTGHCRRFQEARIRRAHEIGERLAAAGAPIDIEAVMADADGGVVGRPHVARALVAAGHVKDFQEAFDRYLAEGRPACVSKLVVDAQTCIAVIREAGGIAIVAHPGLGNNQPLIPRLIAAGAVGVEVWHSAHDTATTEQIEWIANQHGLLKSGGSDCHGTIKGQAPILGNYGLDTARWEKLRRHLLAHTHHR
jgi:predicted metal-dependent phosphoesterase TrpH